MRARILGLATSVVVALLVPLATAPPASTASTFKMVTWNIGGAQFGAGTANWAWPIRGWINDNGSVDAIALQEVCASQAAWIEQNLDGYHGLWVKGPNTRERCAEHGGAAEIGDYILVNENKYPNAVFGTYTIDASYNDGTKVWTASHTLKCATISQVRACSTHLISKSPSFTDDAYDALKLGLAQDIKALANTWISQGRAVAVAGDFNNAPTDAAMTPLYRVEGGSGPFNEVSQTFSSPTPSRKGRPTHYVQSANVANCTPLDRDKIDYIFLSGEISDATGMTSKASGSTYCSEVNAGDPNGKGKFSDHMIYQGTSVY